MRIEVLKQCDVTLAGTGDPRTRKRALFLGQFYDLPDGTDVAALIKAGKVRPVAEPSPRASAVPSPRAARGRE